MQNDNIIKVSNSFSNSNNSSSNFNSVAEDHGKLLMDKEMDGYRLYQQAMKYGISIVPGQIFSAGGNYRHCIRIGYGRNYDDTVEYGLKLLGNLIKKKS